MFVYLQRDTAVSSLKACHPALLPVKLRMSFLFSKAEAKQERIPWDEHE
jgi:hypothetical protein